MKLDDKIKSILMAPVTQERHPRNIETFLFPGVNHNQLICLHLESGLILVAHRGIKNKNDIIFKPSPLGNKIPALKEIVYTKTHTYGGPDVRVKIDVDARVKNAEEIKKLCLDVLTTKEGTHYRDPIPYFLVRANWIYSLLDRRKELQQRFLSAQKALDAVYGYFPVKPIQTNDIAAILTAPVIEISKPTKAEKSLFPNEDNDFLIGMKLSSGQAFAANVHTMIFKVNPLENKVPALKELSFHERYAFGGPAYRVEVVVDPIAKDAEGVKKICQNSLNPRERFDLFTPYPCFRNVAIFDRAKHVYKLMKQFKDIKKKLAEVDLAITDIYKTSMLPENKEKPVHTATQSIANVPVTREKEKTYE